MKQISETSSNLIKTDMESLGSGNCKTLEFNFKGSIDTEYMVFYLKRFLIKLLV